MNKCAEGPATATTTAVPTAGFIMLSCFTTFFLTTLTRYLYFYSLKSPITTHPWYIANCSWSVERRGPQWAQAGQGVIMSTQGPCANACLCCYQRALIEADRVQSESDTQQRLWPERRAIRSWPVISVLLVRSDREGKQKQRQCCSHSCWQDLPEKPVSASLGCFKRIITPFSSLMLPVSYLINLHDNSHVFTLFFLLPVVIYSISHNAFRQNMPERVAFQLWVLGEQKHVSLQSGKQTSNSKMS